MNERHDLSLTARMLGTTTPVEEEQLDEAPPKFSASTNLEKFRTAMKGQKFKEVKEGVFQVQKGAPWGLITVRVTTRKGSTPMLVAKGDSDVEFTLKARTPSTMAHALKTLR